MIWGLETHYVFEIAFTEDWRAILGVFTVVEIEDKVNIEYDLLSNLLSTARARSHRKIIFIDRS